MEADIPGFEQFGCHSANLAGRVHGAHGILWNDGDLPEPERLHPICIPDREVFTIELHPPLDKLLGSCQMNEAVAKRGLPTTGFAGEAHDLAIGDREGRPIQRMYIPIQSLIKDAEIYDL